MIHVHYLNYRNHRKIIIILHPPIKYNPKILMTLLFHQDFCTTFSLIIKGPFYLSAFSQNFRNLFHIFYYTRAINLGPKYTNYL